LFLFFDRLITTATDDERKTKKRRKEKKRKEKKRKEKTFLPSIIPR
jgi:hypothetical protein